MLGKVILLNGCSSSGKTTLAQEIQRLSLEPFQYIALDQFRDGLPPSVRGLNSPAGSPGALGLNVVPVDHPNGRVSDIQFGDFGRKVLCAMRRSIAHLASLGCSVVVDDILFEKSLLSDYANLLEGNSTWVVALRCDLDIVRERESLRAGRFPGTADSHFHSIHSHGIKYDIEVDSGKETPTEMASRILKAIESPPSAISNYCSTET